METFVVRIWVPAEPENGGREPVLRGLVEQVGSGRSQPFVGDESLLAFLREASRGGLRPDPGPGTQQRSGWEP